jgi:hypothetical protein
LHAAGVGASRCGAAAAAACGTAVRT